jgi:thiamine thiazole synthase
MSSQPEPVFSKVAERDITRALTSEFAAQLDGCIESDVLIAGGGPSGLMCAKVLAEHGAKVLIVERNNYLGGGFWLGGYLMNKAVFRAPSNEILDEIGVPYTTPSVGLHVADAPHACARLIAAACDAGARIQNMTSVEDIVMREGDRIAGLVINWTPVESLPRQITCVDPIAIEAKVVVDATGHDATIVKLLEKQGLAEVKGCGPMFIGMAVSAVHGLPRMGPSFGSMLLSGARGAEVVLNMLNTQTSEAELVRA